VVSKTCLEKGTEKLQRPHVVACCRGGGRGNHRALGKVQETGGGEDGNKGKISKGKGRRKGFIGFG